LTGTAARTRFGGGLPAAQDRPAQLAVIGPAVLGPPIVWLASPQARDVHNERMIVTSFSAWLHSGPAGGHRTYEAF
jgi:gluconate 5-dehydrogenase